MPKRPTRTRAPEDLAFITPHVLAWAVSNSHFSRSEIASRLKVTPDELRAWELEEGGAPPPFSKAQELANLLRIPFGFLYLPTPPDSTLPLPDMRALAPSYRPTPEFLDLVNDVLLKQDWYLDHLRESGAAKRLKFVGSYDTSARPVDVATSIRNTLDIATLRHQVGSWSEYLSALARHAETAGILVMRSSVVGNATKRKVSTDEVQGFAIADSVAPVVFVNSGDFKAAQVFTFAHELVHVWIGKTAIADPRPADRSQNDVEEFCNQVAAALLVPENEFLPSWEALAPEKRLSVLTRHFWVSSLVILRRARELGRISYAEFQTLKAQEQEKLTLSNPPGGGDYYRNVVVRMGARFTYTVLQEVNRDALLLRDGARLLNLSVPTLAKFAEMAR